MKLRFHLLHRRQYKGRAPLAHEQAAIAAEQAGEINAAAQSGVQVVVADTTALVVAAYSERMFNDRSLLPDSLKVQQRHSLTLLMGLDLPWQADGLFRDGPGMRADIDAVLRRELQSEAIPFQTVYGAEDARLRHALRAVGVMLGRPLLPNDPLLEAGTGHWTCENCSDPDCERRLFSGLLSRHPA